jgi:elongator complex protein 2
MATGASDGTVHIYTYSTKWTHVQTLPLSPIYPLVLALHRTQTGTILAIGGSSPHIHLYTSPTDQIHFTRGPVLKGHEDWIRGLDFTTSQQHIFLATASQDRYIRLWQISKSLSPTAHQEDDTDALLTAALGGESYVLSLPDSDYRVTFSALLPGHDDWVFTVRFSPDDPETLLSASADASVIVWRPEGREGIWIPETRLGEVSSLKGSTTAQGSSGGFWGAVWLDGEKVGCWGKTGAWRVWEGQGGEWVQKVAVSGCVRPVKGISWDPEGHYLLSARSKRPLSHLFLVCGLEVNSGSQDQTTRLFGEWKHDDRVTWHELARPQIHGYDLTAISAYPPWTFLSGSDEKVLRVFRLPKPTADLIAHLAHTTLDTADLPSTANVPVLGLSNKEETRNVEVVGEEPPLEDYLARYTLAPELEKIYAHPSEVLAVTTSNSGKLIASTCKASTPENAVIRIHSTDTFAEITTLKGHSLSVVRLAFSDDDALLVSVGRDRSWTLFEVATWELVKCEAKAHARIIWDVSFAPTAFAPERVFATASRDKTVKIWRGRGKEWKAVSTVKFGEAVTALAFCPGLIAGAAAMAVGLENGVMCLLLCPAGGETFSVVREFEEGIRHWGAVNQIAWRPGGGKGRWEVASCGDDCSVRIFSVRFDT